MVKKSRIQKIFSYCDPIPDAIIVKNGSEPYVDKMFFYTTGLVNGLFEGCASVLFPDGSYHLIVSSLEADIARNVSQNVSVYGTTQEFYTILRNIISDSSTIGLAYNAISHTDFLSFSKQLDNVTLQDVSNACTSARMIKDAEEIALIHKACGIADRVMTKIPDLIRKDMTETELSAEIDYHLQRYGAKAPAFETISSFGGNTALPHYSHGDKRLKNGDFIVCDFGACYKMYNSDITRTFVYGSASTQQKQIHEIVHTAQKKGIEIIKDGMLAKDVHQQVFDIIETTEYAGRFIHSTGHSLGINVHDGGVGLHPHCSIPLRPGMVLTVEPGVYIPEVGGVRIEDDILVDPSGCTVLTKSPHQLIEI